MSEQAPEDKIDQQQPTKQHGDALEEVVAAEPDDDADQE